MTTYAFPNEIKNIVDYHTRVDSFFTSNVQMAQDLSVTTIPAQDTPGPQMLLYLRQSIPILFCMAWEKFLSELKRSDPSKYHVCFEKQTDKLLKNYYNKAIAEIFLIRNCIVHCNSCASKEYVKFNGRYSLGQKIAEIDSLEIDSQFKIFIAAYDRIINNPVSTLP